MQRSTKEYRFGRNRQTMIMKSLMIIFFAFSLFTGCSNDEEMSLVSELCPDTVILDHDRYVSTDHEAYTIMEASITGDCLAIKFGASGCSGDSWGVQVIDSEDIIEPLPPERFIKLELKNDELCQAFITKETSYDISNLRVDGNEVLLNLKNFDTPISYKY